MTVGIDIGGTHVRAGAVDRHGHVLATVTAPTSDSTDALEAGLVRAVAELAAGYDVAAVGLAVAGFLAADRATVMFAPHLPWRDTDVRERMAGRLRLPVVVEHDVNAALWAEYRFGAARGARVVAHVAIGTGIGAALLLEGTLYRGAHGVAPELGHLCLVPGGRRCPCGKRGCWERYCSGTALATTALEMLEADPSGSTVLAREHATRPGQLTGRQVVDAVREGDRVAAAALAELARWLGRGLVLVCDVYDPDLVVIGGGVGGSSALFLDAAREYCAAHLTGAGHRPMPGVRTAALGEVAGLVGAAELARQAL